MTEENSKQIIAEAIPEEYMRVIEGCQNRLTAVWFRTGLLVMREMILALPYDENNSDDAGFSVMDEKAIAECWPIDWLGPDPGTPRQLNWDELTIPTAWLTQEQADSMNAQANKEAFEEGEPPYHIHKAGEPCAWDVNPGFNASLEALPEALAYLQMIGVMKSE